MKVRIAVLVMTVFAVADRAIAQHRLAIEGNGKLAIVARDGTIETELPWGGIHDLAALPNGNFLLPKGRDKLVEVDPRTGSIVWSYDSASSNGNTGRRVEIHAFQPLDGDRIMIAESGPARIIEIDRSGKLLFELPLVVEHPNPHTDTRRARKLATGNYLVCHEGDGTVREYAPSGSVVWQYRVPLFGREPRPGHGPEAFGNKCFAALRLGNGNTLIATGNGHGVLEVSPAGAIVWQIAQHDLPNITLAWTTTVEVLPNGHYLFGNCHAGAGQPLIVELDPATKQVVWTFDRFETFGNAVSTWQTLDGDSAIK
ncbi:MAG TPA: PQQ-binding-like beta-propeller repeat protein [Pirellulales bacterium]|nr:PQQ-binding-like beta-propeller repeat protein [Pirellulales bacterium]